MKDKTPRKTLFPKRVRALVRAFVRACGVWPACLQLRVRDAVTTGGIGRGFEAGITLMTKPRHRMGRGRDSNSIDSPPFPRFV